MQRPNMLKRKLGGLDHIQGKISDDAVAKAERAVERVGQRYQVQARSDLVEMKATFSKLAADRQHPEQYLSRLSAMGREMKGQAGTFGYDLLTRFGDSLYELTRNMRQLTDRHVELIRVHLDAIEVVIDQDIRGTGGAIGEELSNSLRQAIQRVAAAGN
jgi:hypothetical protein